MLYLRGHNRWYHRVIVTTRLEMLRLDSAAGHSTFADDVRRGLTARSKFLLPMYFYDPLGSRLFEAICHLPEYYPTRTEQAILSQYCDTLAELAAPQHLIELGSGSSVKTRLLIEAFLERGTLHYLPVDISESALQGSTRELLRLYPDLTITAVAGEYATALGELSRRSRSGPTLLIFLGSSIGNLDTAESRALFHHCRGVLRPGDSLLLGADLKKSSEVLVPAYDDPLGVTSAFNLNLLVRINRELGGEFRPEDFRHRAVYNEEAGRIELYIVSREAQAVPIRALDVVIELESGEAIHTENSHKYDLEQLASLARDTGLELSESWTDDDRLFSVNLLRVAD